MSDPRPIGVFDSGVGGFTVLRELRALLVAEGWGRIGWPTQFGGLGGTIVHRAVAALRAVLETVRPRRGRLAIVLGAGGDRDPRGVADGRPRAAAWRRHAETAGAGRVVERLARRRHRCPWCRGVP